MKHFVIAMKLKTKYKYHTATILVFYILQKVT
jgi:hypothetical protein